MVPITAIILTYNESKNIIDCLESLRDFTDDIVIVDSGSNDNTLELASKYTQKFYQHEFVNYSLQRNWAFQNVNCKYNWILNVDADHRLTPQFKKEIKEHFNSGIDGSVNGFMASRRTMFLGKWIKHGGHYPVYHGVIFRKGFGICEEKEYDQHFLIEGRVIKLGGDVLDIITDSLDTFITRHNKWATLEARDICNSESSIRKIRPLKNGNAMEKRRYQRLKYYSYPIFWRVFLYFFYRFILKGGFRDGKEGLIFHFLQGFWFRFLVDSKIYEQALNIKSNTQPKKQIAA